MEYEKKLKAKIKEVLEENYVMAGSDKYFGKDITLSEFKKAVKEIREGKRDKIQEVQESGWFPVEFVLLANKEILYLRLERMAKEISNELIKEIIKSEGHNIL